MIHDISLKPIGTGRLLPALSACLLTALFLTSCHSDNAIAPQDRTDSAIQEMRDAHVHRSERGKLQLRLDAPLIQKFDRPKARTLYRSNDKQRVHLRIYDDNSKLKVSIEADYAVSFDDRDIMEAHDSVVVIDYKGGDTIYLQDLIWNSAEDRIYSENPVRAKNGNRLTEGDGFTSNQSMDDMRIIRQRGVIEFND